MVNRGDGGWGGVNVLDEYNTGPKEKMETNVHAAQDKPASAQKKMLLGLQLDMASKCRLV